MKRPTRLYVVLSFFVATTSMLAQAQETKQLEYPYNAAQKVKIYSYESQYQVVLEEDESSVQKTEPVMDILGRQIRKNTIKDEITLSEKQKVELFSIFTAPLPDRAEVTFCFDPRHLIVFYDASDKPFAYIELCLECGIDETSKPFYVNFSLQNTREISAAFTRFGIKYFGPKE